MYTITRSNRLSIYMAIFLFIILQQNAKGLVNNTFYDSSRNTKHEATNYYDYDESSYYAKSDETDLIYRIADVIKDNQDQIKYLNNRIKELETEHQHFMV